MRNKIFIFTALLLISIHYATAEYTYYYVSPEGCQPNVNCTYSILLSEIGNSAKIVHFEFILNVSDTGYTTSDSFWFGVGFNKDSGMVNS